MNTTRNTCILLAAGIALIGCGASPEGPDRGRPVGEAEVYRSPLDVAFSPDGEMLAVSDHTAGSLAMIDASTGKVSSQIELRGRPMSLAWSDDSRTVYVAEHTAGTVAEVRRSGEIVRRFSVVVRPTGLAIAHRRRRLLVADSVGAAVAIVDLACGKEIARAQVVREPRYIAVTPDESLAVVGNRLPAGDTGDLSASAVISLIGLESNRTVANITLPQNATNVLGVVVSPDGKWAYAAHNLGRTMLPTEQVEYGWINANAISIIDLRARKHYATILADQPWNGTANPWGLAVSPDGSTLWIVFSGVHELGRLDLKRLHAWLYWQLPRLAEGGLSLDAAGNDGRVRGARVFSEAYTEPPDEDATGQVELVAGRLPAAYGGGVYLHDTFAWIDLPGNGPRGLAISPDGKRLAAAMYFSGSVVMVDAESHTVKRTIELGPQRPVDDARRGEAIFHDATRCYEYWLSCATCHPDGRVDGLNWDLLNDGIGSPKNTRSLLWSHRTPPVMSEGVRENMESAVDSGFRFILFQQTAKPDLQAVQAYLRSMKPEPSPFLVDGELSAKARRGRRIFNDSRTGCRRCHPAPLYTDLKAYDVSTKVKSDYSGKFDTPVLVELWRTAPYLHHGRARTLQQVFTKFNPGDKHGKTSHLSSDDIDALAEYLKSL